MSKSAVPVIMYHSVGLRNLHWNFGYLTCPYQIFEKHLKWLKSGGYTSITLQELFDSMSFDKDLPNKSIVLTFDDGYADNWVFAYPLLKKYGFKAAIYINPEFVDPRQHPRKNLDDFWAGDVEFDDLSCTGYLAWEEMKHMEVDGIIDIQSHTMSHTWLPKSDRIIDFRYPNDPYIWMTWNQNIDKKPFLQKDNEQLKYCGQPVFDHDRAIGCKQFIPNKEFDSLFIEHVKEQGGKDFFSSATWKNDLFTLYDKYRGENCLVGRYETDDEYEQRLQYELESSKIIIERKLSKDVRFLCWPGGVTTPKADGIAQNLGYLSSNVTKDMREKKRYLKNQYGENPNRISRFGPSLYWDGVEGKESKIAYKGGFSFLMDIERFRSSGPTAIIMKYLLGGLHFASKFCISKNILK